MPRLPPRSTLFPYTDALPISPGHPPLSVWLPPRKWRRRRVPRAFCPRPYTRPQDRRPAAPGTQRRSEEHTSELQSRSDLVCRLLLEKKKKKNTNTIHTNTSKH